MAKQNRSVDHRSRFRFMLKKYGDMEALHVHFQLAELDAAASEPRQVTAAQLGDTRER